MQNFFVECTINCSKALILYKLHSKKSLEALKPKYITMIFNNMLERSIELFYMILPLADTRWRHTTRYPGVLRGASNELTPTTSIDQNNSIWNSLCIILSCYLKYIEPHLVLPQWNQRHCYVPHKNIWAAWPYMLSVCKNEALKKLHFKSIIKCFKEVTAFTILIFPHRL